MNLLTYKERFLKWVPSGYEGYGDIKEVYLSEVENIILTDDELLEYLSDSSIAVINIIKLNKQQTKAYKKRL